MKNKFIINYQKLVVYILLNETFINLDFTV